MAAEAPHRSTRPVPLATTNDEIRPLPAKWRRQITAALVPRERVLAWLLPDLDSALHYADSAVVLTDRRLISFAPSGAAAGDGHVSAPQSWPLEQLKSMRATDRWGLGTLELLGGEGPLAQWRYTVARAAAAHRLALRTEAALAGNFEDEHDSGEPEGDIDDVSLAPPTTGALLRLFVFARQRAGLIVLGFVLTLGATAAGLVPPYLIGPLVDDVLVPYQNQVEAIRNAKLDPAAQFQQLEALHRLTISITGRSWSGTSRASASPPS